MTELPELPPTPKTKLYGEEFLTAALEEIDREALWLLLSIHHYGYRAHRDIAALLLGEAATALGEDSLVHHAEHRAMAALEELFLLLDQLWRVIDGIQSHRKGDGFLSGYRTYGASVKEEFERLQELEDKEWRDLFTLPKADELPDVLFERGIVDLEELQEARALIDDLIATSKRNMDEVAAFFVRVEDPAGGTAKSVRDINNAYRHGTQIVYEDVAPAEIPWKAANPEEGEGLLVGVEEVDEASRVEAVNILMEEPDDEGHGRYASYPRDDEWASGLLLSMENLSVLLNKLVVSFLLGIAGGGPVIGTLLLDWEQLDADQGP